MHNHADQQIGTLSSITEWQFQCGRKFDLFADFGPTESLKLHALEGSHHHAGLTIGESLELHTERQGRPKDSQLLRGTDIAFAARTTPFVARIELFLASEFLQCPEEAVARLFAHFECQIEKGVVSVALVITFGASDLTAQVSTKDPMNQCCLI